MELVIPFRDHLDDSGAVSSSCSDNSADQTVETLVTNTEKQTTQSAMYMERLAQLEEERTRMETTMKRKERPQTHTELTTLAKPKVSTREARDWNWSFIFEAYNETGSTQLAQNLKGIQDGGTTPLLAELNERERETSKIIHGNA